MRKFVPSRHSYFPGSMGKSLHNPSSLDLPGSWNATMDESITSALTPDGVFNPADVATSPSALEGEYTSDQFLGKTPPVSALQNSALGAVGLGGVVLLGVGLLAIGPFVVMPAIIKAFKPEWPYGRRVAAGFGVSLGIGALTGIARALGGTTQVVSAPTAPAAKTSSGISPDPRSIFGG